MLLKEGFAMRDGEIIIKGSVSADRQQDLICLFGKLEFHMGYHPYKEDGRYENEVDFDRLNHAWVTVIFEGLPCADLLTIYKFIEKANLPLRYRGHHNAAKIPGIRIRVNEETDTEIFMRAMRQITALAFAEIPPQCINADINVDDNAELLMLED
jgi:hypothetical protein